jgi:hypothetical protein
LNFGHCDLPFDLAQGGGELVEPFEICALLFEIFLIAESRHLNPDTFVPFNMLPEKPRYRPDA